MNNEYFLQEIEVSYTNKIKIADRLKITCSNDADSVFRQIWGPDVDYKESTYVLLLDGGNNILGYHLVSKGGRNSTVVDVAEVLQVALKVNALALVLGHNHPSGTNSPSREDEAVTNKLKQSCELMGIRFLDHLIITSEKYYSFTDEGKI